jgi:Transglycosylase SLT domain
MALGSAGGMVLAGTAQAAVRPAAARTGPVAAHLTSAWLPPPPGKSAPAASTAKSSAQRSDPLHQVVLPDLFAVAPRGVSTAQFGRLSKLRYVRDLTAVDGGGVKIEGHVVSTIGVNTGVFRSWTPPQTASNQRVWTALAHGELMTTTEAVKKLGLRRGKSYRVSGATQADITSGGTAAFGIPDVDAVVNSRNSRSLGLLPRIGVLLSAPGANLVKLESHVRAVLGRGTKFENLRASKLDLRPPKQTFHVPRPVDTQMTTSRPSNYLELFQQSAKLYCPGLSWTVLAAIGQIESADGQNTGPSSAGALGPMQFLPSTWARWGITATAFGQTGPPDINNAYDAVPSAARYLCSYGAAQGGAALSRAIYGYNHAAWYVAEVLALAHEYAQEYG